MSATPQTKAPPSVSETTASDESATSTDQPIAGRMLRWLGRFHILVVHFPIALLMAAAAAEIWSLWRKERRPSPAARFCLFLGAVSAVVAVALGWLHADWGGFGAESPAFLRWHRWTGTVLGAWAVVTALLGERDARRGQRSRIYWVLLCLCVGLTGLVAHLGGSLVHGTDFLDW